MGIDGCDFIGNPNQIEYTDDELDVDDFPRLLNETFDDEYVGGEDADDGDEDDDGEDEEDFISSPSLSCRTSPDASDLMDDFLTDEDDDSEEGDLVGYMVNGVFVQTGGPVISTRSRTAAADATQGVAESAPQPEEVKNGNEDVAASQDVSTRAEER